jgi:hypothetical protein
MGNAAPAPVNLLSQAHSCLSAEGVKRIPPPLYLHPPHTPLTFLSPLIFKQFACVNLHCYNAFDAAAAAAAVDACSSSSLPPILLPAIQRLLRIPPSSLPALNPFVESFAQAKQPRSPTASIFHPLTPSSSISYRFSRKCYQPSPSEARTRNANALYALLLPPSL